jgi:hypothetical protein
MLSGVPGASHIRWTAFGQIRRDFGFWRTMSAGIHADADSFSISGLRFTGPRAARTYVANDALVTVCGRSSTERRRRFSIRDSELTLSGAYAIHTQFVSDLRIDNNWIHDCGYIAVELCSCDNGHVQRNRIRSIGPGSNANMYGIVMDHDSTAYASDPNAGTKRATNPFCERCVIFDNEVEDVAWEGIDMHGGYENQVIHNRVYDTLMGISCGSGSGSASGFAGYGNVVAYNLVDARKPNGTAGTPGRANAHYGINANGGRRASNDGVKVVGNTLIQKGRPSDNSLGAIQVTFCTNAQVSGNSLSQWGGVGVLCNEGSENVAITDNQFLELAALTDNSAIAVHTSATSLPGLVVSRNSLSANGGAAARVGFSGARLRTRPRLSDNEFGVATAARHVLPATGFLVGNDGPVVIALTPGQPLSVAEARGAPHVVLLVPASAPIRVSAIEGAVDGQAVEIVNTGEAPVTFARERAVLGEQGVWVGSQYDTLVLRLLGANWHAIPRSSNR